MDKIIGRGAFMVDKVEPSPMVPFSEEVPELPAIAGIQGLFMVAGNNLGKFYNEFTNNPAWLQAIDSIGFTGVAYSAGAEDHWFEYQSKMFWPETTIVSPNVGMRCNPDMIEAITGSSGGAANLHRNLNATGVDFFEVTLDYCKRYDKIMVFTLNIARGTLLDAAQYLAYITSKGVSFILRYGNEQATGETSLHGGSQDFEEYSTKLLPIHEYVKANYPEVKTILSIAKNSNANWPHEDIREFIEEQGIDGINQYFWMGDNAGAPNENTVIADYFTQAIANLRDTGNDSLYIEIIPRLTEYFNSYQMDSLGIKLHMGQWGTSLQRGGYVAQTMLHAILIWNALIEIIRLSLDNLVYIDEGVFLTMETAVDQYVGSDNHFDINPAFLHTDGEGNVFVTRTTGEAFKMMKELAQETNAPTIITITHENDFPEGLDMLALKLANKTIIYIYNIYEAFIIDSMEVNSVALGSDTLLMNTMSGDEIWASIGNTPAFTYFKNLTEDNPGLAAANVQRMEDIIAGSTITIPKHSITTLEILDNSNVTSINLIF